MLVPGEAPPGTPLVGSPMIDRPMPRAWAEDAEDRPALFNADVEARIAGRRSLAGEGGAGGNAREGRETRLVAASRRIASFQFVAAGEAGFSAIIGEVAMKQVPAFREVHHFMKYGRRQFAGAVGQTAEREPGQDYGAGAPSSFGAPAGDFFRIAGNGEAFEARQDVALQRLVLDAIALRSPARTRLSRTAGRSPACRRPHRSAERSPNSENSGQAWPRPGLFAGASERFARLPFDARHASTRGPAAAAPPASADGIGPRRRRCSARRYRPGIDGPRRLRRLAVGVNAHIGKIPRETRLEIGALLGRERFTAAR